MLVCAPIHVLTQLLARGRSPWPQWFLASAAWIVGVRVRVTGAPATPHTLLIANHTSWLDILVLGGATGCAFVSKAELGHPVIHWLADQDGTVYVHRAQRSAAKDQTIAIADALERDKPVVLFPEGTTGPGTHLLPFRSTLLEAANFASKDVLVRPVAVDYGAAAPQVGWFHEPGKENVLRLLGRKGTLPVTIRILPPLDRSGDRKQLAAEASAAIADTLGFKSQAHSPIAAHR
ncbi:MAG TPA: lysophospholipid acyltransferase family protein [Sphingomicrobium sp.]|nr:lysophospholipid acyltransferase family protein [Sphingomicrobium sp.]